MFPTKKYLDTSGGDGGKSLLRSRNVTNKRLPPKIEGKSVGSTRTLCEPLKSLHTVSGSVIFCLSWGLLHAATKAKAAQIDAVFFILVLHQFKIT